MARTDTIGSHKTNISTANGVTQVRYHSTVVVEFDADQVTLNSGGWRTVTTKTRMNQASNQFGLGFQVFQKQHEWFVENHGQVYPFEDGMTINR